MMKKQILLFVLSSMLAAASAQQVYNFQGPGQLRDLLYDGPDNFCINPIAIDQFTMDSIARIPRLRMGTSDFKIRFNSPIYQIQSNSKVPTNHTSNFLIPNVGLQQVFTVGLNLDYRDLIELNLQPIHQTTENLPFHQYPEYSKEWLWYYYFLNRIDMPDRFSDKPLSQGYLGPSYFRLKISNVAVTISNENKWWGPASFNPLVLGSNAPGFNHLGIRNREPINTTIGKFGFEIIAGTLQNSGYLPPDTNRVNIYNGQRLYEQKIEADRYTTGLIYTYQPKWIPGLTLGLTKLSMAYRNETKSFYDFLPLTGFVGDRLSLMEREKRKASMGSWFARYLMPKIHSEVYFEYGRGDRSLHVWNIMQPKPYTRGFTAGLKKSFEITRLPGHFIQIGTEMTNLSLPTKAQVKGQDPQSWYIHNHVRQGFTHRGTVLGSQLGPGSNGQNVYVQYIHGLNRIGIRFLRTIHNLDYYHYTGYYLSDHFNQYWASAGALLYSTWYVKNFSVNMQCGIHRELNHQWDWVRYTDIGFENIGNDIYNFSANLMLSYHL